MALKFFIFDLDGTVFDTESPIINTWKETLLDYGYDVPVEKIKYINGLTNDGGIKKLGVSVDDKFSRRWAENHEKHADEITYFDGIQEVLSELKRKGMSTGVVSSRNILEYNNFFLKFRLEEIFDLIVLDEDTKKHKPEPEPLLYYAQKMDAKPEECIYIGDMISDVECANNAHMASGFVKYNNSGIECDKATFVFDSPYDILKLAE